MVYEDMMVYGDVTVCEDYVLYGDVLVYGDITVREDQGGNFTAMAAVALHFVRPQWPLCPWPGQHSGLALSYSHLSSKYHLQ